MLGLFFGLGCAKDGAYHSDAFALSSNSSRNKRPTYFILFYSCTLGTGYVLNI